MRRFRLWLQLTNNNLFFVIFLYFSFASNFLPDLFSQNIITQTENEKINNLGVGPLATATTFEIMIGQNWYW